MVVVAAEQKTAMCTQGGQLDHKLNASSSITRRARLMRSFRRPLEN